MIKRCAFTNSAGEILQLSMCKESYAAEWCRLNGFDHWVEVSTDDDVLAPARVGDELQLLPDGGKHERKADSVKRTELGDQIEANPGLDTLDMLERTGGP